MSVRSPRVKGNCYIGSLANSVCNKIDKVLSKEKLESLEYNIYNFPKELREKAKELKKSTYEYVEELGVREDYRIKLRDYQTIGVGFMYLSPRSILGDAAGLGKTPQICGMINQVRESKVGDGDNVYSNKKRILIAAENSAVGQIADEVERFTGLRVEVLHSEGGKMSRQLAKFYQTRVLDGTLPKEGEVEYTPKGNISKKKPPEVIDYEVLIVKHSTLRSDKFYTWYARVKKDFGMFILDESYVVKNKGTKIYKDVEVLCDCVDRVHFLNATVFETKLLDIVNQIDLVDKSILPLRGVLTNLYCEYKQVMYPIRGGQGRLGKSMELVGYRNQEIFKKSLKYVYMTRKRREVKLTSTERLYSVYTLEATKKQKKAIKEGYRYFEVLNCPSLCEDIGIETTKEEVPKLERLERLVAEDYEGESVMVYVWHIEAQEQIKKMLEGIGRKVAILNGETVDRDKVREDFNSGKYDVIITNAKRSLNLHSAGVCIFYSMETNPAAVEQIAARIDRNIDDKTKSFVLLVYEGEEAEFFKETVRQRAEDGMDLADTLSETVLNFGKILLASES